MVHYGRPSHPSSQKKPSSRPAAGIVLVLGCVMAVGFFIASIRPWKTESDAVPADAVAVMSTSVTEEPEQVQGAKERYHTGAEPFGYMDGEWNLWEYIGDLMVSLLS